MRRVLFFIVIIALILGGVWLYKKNKSSGTPTAGTSAFKTFFPSASDIASTTQNGNLTTQPTPVAAPVAVSPFTQISSGPVAGFNSYTDTYTISIPSLIPKKKPTIQTITDQVLRYISRGNGYVYEKRNTDNPLQISNLYIPNIYEASFADTNNTAILRFLRDDQQTIATYTVPVPPKNPDGTRTQTPGKYLPDNIAQLVVSPDESEVATLYTNGAYSDLFTGSSQNKNGKEVLRSPFHEWLSMWPNKNTLYLQTKASNIADGFLYKIDRTEKRLRRVLGNIKGLTASVSPSGTYVIYSESVGNTFYTKILNTKTNQTATLSLKILPEKCTWLANEDLVCAGNNSIADANYPDNWYQGLTHFSDQLYHIYPNNTTYDILYDGNGPSFDMTKIEVNEITHLAYFIDKNTGILWQFNLAQ